MTARERLAFLRGYLRDPAAVGSVTPSSAGLARAMARLAGTSGCRTVAELGAGTGPVTEALLHALPPDGRLWAFEIDPAFVSHLRARFPDPRLTVVDRTAAELPRVLEAAGVERVDAVVSELPFSLLGRSLTREILAAANTALRPGGIFLALQYHPWYLPPFLREAFGGCERRPYLWNVPPALLLRATKPGKA